MFIQAQRLSKVMMSCIEYRSTDQRGGRWGKVSSLEGEALQLVGAELVLVVQHRIVRGAAGALDACMRVQVEVVQVRRHYAAVHHSACIGTLSVVTHLTSIR